MRDRPGTGRSRILGIERPPYAWTIDKYRRHVLSAPKAATVLTRYAECCPGLPPQTWDPRLGRYRGLTPGEIAKARKHLRRERLRRMNRILTARRRIRLV